MTQALWKKIVLGSAIAIVFVLLTLVGISTFYHEPKYDQFCPKRDIDSREIQDKESCEKEDGVWQEDFSGRVPVPVPVNGSELEEGPRGWCDLHGKCRQEHQDAQRDYNRNVFFIMTGLGTLALFVGVLSRFPLPIAAGFSFGGIINILIGTARFWGDMPEYLRFGVLLIILILLVWVTFKYFKEVKT